MVYLLMISTFLLTNTILVQRNPIIMAEYISPIVLICVSHIWYTFCLGKFNIYEVRFYFFKTILKIHEVYEKCPFTTMLCSYDILGTQNPEYSQPSFSLSSSSQHSTDMWMENSWPLNNMCLNVTDPLIHEFTSINTCIFIL